MDKILIIDDEKSIIDLLTVVFEKEGYSVSKSLSATRGIELIDKEDFDLILTDIKLPQMSGMDILRHVMDKTPNTPVIMITAYGTLKQAVEAFKKGAVDYIVKPFDIEELKIIVVQGLEKRKLKTENIKLRQQLKEKNSFENIIGKNIKMKQIYDLIEKISDSDSTILIGGESGTGKEIAARAIHFNSRRQQRPFVSVNCGALPENLLESELYGHVKGSFTGAIANKKGMFETAEKGTIFLDEMLSPFAQVKLLRTLQDKRIRRVGGNDEILIDVRIIAATNQDLKKRLDEGRFREDLFYRINVISFEMPPLRERRDDIPLLVTHFLEKYCTKTGSKMKRVAPEVYNIFESYAWPGNIRELENTIERTVAIEERETVTLSSLPAELLAPRKKSHKDLDLEPGFDLNKTLDEISKQYVARALDLSSGRLKEAGEILGVNYRSLRYLIEKHGIKTENGK